MSSQESSTVKKLFIISPIGTRNSEIRDHFDKVRNHIIDPVAAEKGYTILRSDEIARPGRITSQIIDHLKNDDLVITDLSRKNPNVYYELAIRHAVHKPVILIGESDLDIPFDLAAQRVIPYSLDPDDIIVAKRQLESQIESVESEIFIVDSPVTDAIEIIPQDPSSEDMIKRILAILETQSKKLTRIEEAIFKPSIKHMISFPPISLISPNKGPVGTEVLITTAGHTSGSIVEIFFDYVKSQSLINTMTAKANGTCFCKIVIPQTSKGMHYIWIRDEDTGNAQNVPFEVL